MNTAKYFIVPYCCSFYAAAILIIKALGEDEMELTDIITTAASIAVPIIVSIIAFAAATKSGNNATDIARHILSKEHVEIKSGQNELKSEQSQIRNEQNELKSIMSTKLDKISEYVTEERTRRTFLDSNQKKISDNMNALLSDWQQVNAENVRLKSENEQLRHRIDILLKSATYEQLPGEDEEQR